MALTGGELTPAEWRVRLAQPTAHAPPLSADTFAREFRPVTQRVRRLYSSAQLALKESLALQPTWRRALELLQILTEHQSAAALNLAPLTELLTATDRALRVLESHLALCEFTLATAERLHPIVDEIVHGAELSSRRLLNVASELTVTLEEAPTTPCLVPAPLFAPAAVLEQAGWGRADWFAQAVMSARLAAALLPAFDFDRDTRGWIVAAALVQDIGTWHQPYRYRHQQVLREGRQRPEPNHPATGAAIVNGLVDASVTLGLLVGGHHERIDGTGFPQRLAGQRLSREQQTLGLLTRLTELLTDPLTGQLAVDHDEPLELAAGMRLWREVRRGSFTEALVRPMLDRLRTGLTDEIAEQYPARVRRLVDVAHEVPAPHGEATKSDTETSQEAESSPVNPPAFLRRQRTRGGSLSRAVRRGRKW
jgi:hypothetical protein